MQARIERYGARFQPPLLTYAWLIMFISCTSRPPVEFSHNGTKIDENFPTEIIWLFDHHHCGGKHTATIMGAASNKKDAPIINAESERHDDRITLHMYMHVTCRTGSRSTTDPLIYRSLRTQPPESYWAAFQRTRDDDRTGQSCPPTARDAPERGRGHQTRWMGAS